MELDESPRIEIPLGIQNDDGNPFESMLKLQKLCGSPVLVVDSKAQDNQVLRSVWIQDPDTMKQVLASEKWIKGQQTSLPFRSIVPLHMIAAEGEQHKRLRQSGQRVLNDQVQDRLLSITEKHAQTLAEKFAKVCRNENNRTTVESLDRWFRAMALDVISQGIFGTAWDALEDFSAQNEKAHALAQLMYVLHERVTNLSDRTWVDKPCGFGAASTHLDVLIPFVRQQIREKKLEAKRNPSDDSMLACWIRDGPDLSEEELENLCMTFLTMGHENVATGIAWTLILLAEHPVVQEQVRKDLQRGSSELSEQAFLEATRLFPSVPVVTRACPQETELCGFSIPPHTEVVFNLYGANRDEETWGESSRQFICPRKKQAMSWSFAAGPRRCVGRPLAQLENNVVLSVFLRMFKLRSLGKQAVQPHNLVSFRPGQHKIELELLDQSKL